MKKALSLILALVLCLSLCACGESSQGVVEDSKDVDIVGEWKGVTGGIFTFKNDGTLDISGETAEWWYDDDEECYNLSYDGVTLSFTIEEDDGMPFFEIDGDRFYHAYYFEKLFGDAPADLIGEWYLDTSDTGNVDYIIYEFNEDGTVYHLAVNAYDSGHKVSSSGSDTYKVRDGVIYCTSESNGAVYTFTYVSSADGTIKLYRDYDGEKELVKGNWNDYLESNR